MCMMTPTRIFDLFPYQLQQTSGINIFNYGQGEEWVNVTTQEFIDRVNQISKGLIALGVRPHDTVGLISENRLEWNLMDFAIQQIGAVVVAIYPNISDADYTYILPHAEVKWCFVSNEKLYKRLDNIRQQVSVLEKNILSISMKVFQTGMK